MLNCKRNVADAQRKASKVEQELSQARQELQRLKQTKEDVKQDLSTVCYRLERLLEDLSSDGGVSDILQKFLLVISEAITREKNLGECLMRSPRDFQHHNHYVLQLMGDLLVSYRHIFSDDMQNYSIPERRDILNTLQVIYILCR